MNTAHSMAIRAILKEAIDEIQLLLGQPVTLELGLPPTTKENILLIKEIKLKKIICDVCQVSWNEVASQSRKREIVQARHLYCYHAKPFLGLSLKAIGEHIGERDHTTVIHGKQTIQDLLDSNDAVVTALNHSIVEAIEAIEELDLLNTTEAIESLNQATAENEA